MTPDQRSKLWHSFPRASLTDRHTSGCRVLPDREALLREMTKGGCCAEVGVATGNFSSRIMELAEPSRLHLIDDWQDEVYRDGLGEIRRRFSGEIESGKIVIDQGRSTEVLQRFSDAYFDWLYIDTDHTFGTTAKELAIAMHKVKPSGRIMGHDFCMGNVVTPVIYGVIQACNKFCVDHGWRYEYLTLESHGHFSFCLRRLSAP